jgi:glycine/D-amino acid oxidase-like deaminating enzyme
VKVVIVGAGVLGAALAQTLTRHGRAVTLVEQYEPGHARAASDAHSRILRMAHGGDVHETRSAWLARSLWLQLERDTGTQLFSEVGMAWFAPAGDSAWEEAGGALLGEEDIPTERLSPFEAARLFPSLCTHDLGHILFEPHAGLLRPREAVRALVGDAIEAGAEFLQGHATPDGEGVALDEQRLEADRVVWACGAWTPRLFPDLVRGTVIQQDVFYFDAPGGWATPPLPAWGEWRENATGAGNFLGSGFKVGVDAPGPPFDPDSGPGQPARGHEAHARAYLNTRFPAVATAPLVRTETCQTVVLEPSLPEPAALLGGEVRVLRHPEHEHVWLLGDGSGHAFKHAPTIAMEMESLLA